LDVDVIDPANSATVVYLDDKRLPVGSWEFRDFIPRSSSAKRLLYRFSFPEPDVLGKAKTAVVYTTSTWY
jgi:hypothetical protein